LVSALSVHDHVLANFSLGFLFLSLLTVILVKQSYLQLALHVLLNGFLFGFTLTPFCGIYYLSGILIYPLIISLAIFFVQEPLRRLIYTVLCIVTCLVFIYKSKGIDYTVIESNFIAEFLIVFGLLSALFIIGYNYFVVVFRYQAKLEKSETLLQQNNKELSQYIDSNLQLENFAHLASHELKTPLRNIISFSNLLAAKLRDTIPDKENEMLGIIENQANEMNELIKDLFELSSVTNEPMKTSEVQLPYMLHNLIKFDFFDHKENISIRSLPRKINANKSYIKEVFKNLISNALKFVEKNNIPEIIIDCQELPNEYQFSVADNGIGIHKEKRDKVFLIFKRLHTRCDYEGTGIGLAICKKIIERHLGKIWIEDSPTGGTTFKFTIAKSIA